MCVHVVLERTWGAFVLLFSRVCARVFAFMKVYVSVEGGHCMWLCVCLCLCVFVRMYFHVCIVCVHESACAHVHIRVCACYKCVSVWRVCKQMCACVRMCVRVCARACVSA